MTTKESPRSDGDTVARLKGVLDSKGIMDELAGRLAAIDDVTDAAIEA
jgi:hypothetical protein